MSYLPPVRPLMIWNSLPIFVFLPHTVFLEGCNIITWFKENRVEGIPWNQVKSTCLRNSKNLGDLFQMGGWLCGAEN